MQQNGGFLNLLWRFIRPQADEMIAYVAVLIIVLGVAAYKLAINGEIGSDTLDITTSLHNALSTTAEYMSRGSGWAKFFLFGFWFIIGGIAYTLAWATATIIIDIRNDIKISATFIHPRSFRASDFWVSIIARTALRAISAIALLFYSVFWLWVFAPVWVNVDQKLINNPSTPRNLIDFGLSLIWVIVTLHIGAILVRLALLRPTHNATDGFES